MTWSLIKQCIIYIIPLTHPDTKCWLSGEKATVRTQELWPDSVPAKLACCLKNNDKVHNEGIPHASYPHTHTEWTQTLSSTVAESPPPPAHRHVHNLPLTHRISSCPDRLRLWRGAGSLVRSRETSPAWRDLTKQLLHAHNTTLEHGNQPPAPSPIPGRFQRASSEAPPPSAHWPSRVCSSLPVCRSNKLMIPSIAPEATSFPSGLCEKTPMSK